MNTRKMQLAGLMLAMGLSGAAHAASYSVTTLGFFYANALNDSGQVVGYSSSYPGSYQVFDAVVYSGGSMTSLGLANSRAWDINNSGQIVGDSNGQAFLYSGGNVTDLGLGGAFGLAYGINNNGQVVGSASTLGGTQQAFLYSGGSTTNFGGSNSRATGISDNGLIVGVSSGGEAFNFSTGGSISMPYTTGGNSFYDNTANAINNSGQIVGAYNAFNPSDGLHYTRGFFSDAGNAVELGDPPLITTDPFGSPRYWFSTSNAYGINENGQVVGVSGDHGFLYSNGVMTNLNNLIDPSSGWVIFDARDINESGQIAANGFNTITGERGALLLSVTAVPEPETYAMLLTGLGLVGWVARRRKQVL